MRALVTGIEGFSGSSLAEHLLECGDEVSGTVCPGAPTENLAGIRERLRLAEVDVCDADALSAFFAEARPEVVYHLAGLLSSFAAERGPEDFWSVNFGGTINAVEASLALRKLPPPAGGGGGGGAPSPWARIPRRLPHPRPLPVGEGVRRASSMPRA